MDLKHGLNEKKHDDGLFKVGAIFDLPKLSEIPSYFLLKQPFPAKNQHDTDECSIFTAAGMSELEDGVEFEPTFTFAQVCNPEEWGLTMQQAMKAACDIGFLPKSLSPFSLENKDAGFLRIKSNWPADCLAKAKPYKKQSYFDVTGQYDCFDDIRATLWKFQDKNRAVSIGVRWSWALSDTKIETISDEGNGHMMYAVGCDGEYLIVRNSGGPEAGKDGNQLFHRSVINYFVPKFGAMVLVDMPKDQVGRYMLYGIKDSDTVILKAVKTIIGLLMKCVFDF